MKKLSAIVLALLLILLFSVSAFAKFDVIVDDAANIFAIDEYDSVVAAAYEYAATGDFSVAVVTTDDAMGKSAMEYADDYYDNLIFNSGWSEDGMCFLIDMDNREIYVSCAGSCIYKYNDYDLQTIVDKGFDCVSYGEYAKGMIAMIDEAAYLASGIYSDSADTGIYWTDDTYGENLYYDEYYYGGNSAVNAFEISHVLIYIVIGLVAGAIAVIVVKNKYKNTGIGDEFNADDVFLEVTASSDNLISRNVITTKIPKNNNNHRSGGGGGGTSTHRSSGGISHSGAGRKF